MSNLIPYIITFLIAINVQFIITQNDISIRAISDVQLTKIEMDDSRTVLNLIFDGDTNRGPNGTRINCQYYFVNSAILGTKSKCEWSSPSVLTVYLGTDALISFEDKLTLIPGSIRDTNNDNIEGESTIVLKDNFTKIKGVINGPNAIYKENLLFLDGSRSVGRGIRDFDYFWNISACLLNVCSEIQELDQIREKMSNSPQLSINISTIPIMYDVLITLKVVNYLNEESDVTSLRIKLSNVQIPQVILYGPIFEVPSTQPFVYIDTLILNAEEASLKYKWQVSPLLESEPNLNVKDLKIPISSLPVGIPIDIRLFVNDFFLAQTKLTVKKDIENSFIDGGDRTFYISYYNNLTLDGSKVPSNNEEDLLYLWTCHYNESNSCEYSDGSDLMESVTTQMKIVNLPTATLSKRLPPGEYKITLSVVPQSGNLDVTQYVQKIILKEHSSLKLNELPSDVSINVISSKLMDLNVYDEFPLKLEILYKNLSNLTLTSPHGKINIGKSVISEPNYNCLRFDKNTFIESDINYAEMMAITTSEKSVNSSSMIRFSYHYPPFKRMLGDFDYFFNGDTILSYYQYALFRMKNWIGEHNKPLLRYSLFYHRNGKEKLLLPPSSYPQANALLPSGDDDKIKITLRVYDSYGSYADISKSIEVSQYENEKLDTLINYHSTFEKDEKKRMMMATLIADFLEMRNTTINSKNRAISLLIDELNYFSTQKSIDDFTFYWIIQTLETLITHSNDYQKMLNIFKVLPYENIARRENYVKSLENIFAHIIKTSDDSLIIEIIEIYDKLMQLKMKYSCSTEPFEPLSSSYFDSEYTILQSPYTSIQLPNRLLDTFNSPRVYIPKSFFESVTDEQSIIVKYSRLNIKSHYLDSGSNFNGIPVLVELLKRDGISKIDFNNTNSTFDIYWPQTELVEGKCIWKTNFHNEWKDTGCEEKIFEDKVMCRCNHMTIFSFSLKDKELPIWIWILVGVLSFILLTIVIALVIYIVKRKDKNKKAQPVDSRDTLTPFPAPPNNNLSEDNFDELRKFKPVISNRNLHQQKNSDFEVNKSLSTSEISRSNSNDSPFDYYSSLRSGKAFDEIELDLRISNGSFGRSFNKKRNLSYKGRKGTGSSTKISRALDISDNENDNEENQLKSNDNINMDESSDDISQS